MNINSLMAILDVFLFLLYIIIVIVTTKRSSPVSRLRKRRESGNETTEAVNCIYSP